MVGISDASVLRAIGELELRGILDRAGGKRLAFASKVSGQPARPAGIPVMMCEFVEKKLQHILEVVFYLRCERHGVASETHFLHEAASFIFAASDHALRTEVEFATSQLNAHSPLLMYVAAALYVKHLAERQNPPLIRTEGEIVFMNNSSAVSTRVGI